MGEPEKVKIIKRDFIEFFDEVYEVIEYEITLNDKKHKYFECEENMFCSLCGCWGCVHNSQIIDEDEELRIFLASIVNEAKKRGFVE